MKQIMPQEIEVWYIIPAIRKEFAFFMHKQGLSQKDIAKNLGVTEPAVSQYLKQKRANKIHFDKGTMKEIEISVGKILKNSNVMSETQRICRLLMKNLTVCRLHQNLDPNIPKKCDLCMVS